MKFNRAAALCLATVLALQPVVSNAAASVSDNSVPAETESDVPEEPPVETEVETPSETESETETEVPTEVETETETESGIPLEPETETEISTETEVETELPVETETQTEIEIPTETLPDSQVSGNDLPAVSGNSVSSVSANSVSARAVREWDVSENGDGSVKATFDPATGTLTFSGSGRMKDFRYDENVPWIGMCGSIENVNISTGITYIGSKAFTRCEFLTTLHLPSVVAIGQYAFDGCISLTSVRAPELTEIPRGLFRMLTSLEEVYAPNVTSIGNDAFEDCSKLIEAKFPLATSIGSTAFRNCTGLERVYFDNLSVIDQKQVFEGCSSLAHIYMPKLVDIGDRFNYEVFSGCSSLESVSFPSLQSVTSNRIFSGCTNLKMIELPAMETFDVSYFAECLNLESLRLPSVRSIIRSKTPFDGFKLLHKLEIPENCEIDGGTLINSRVHPNQLVNAEITGAAFSGVAADKVSTENLSGHQDMFVGIVGLKEVVVPESSKVKKLNLTGEDIRKIVWLGDIDGTMTKDMINPVAMVYCVADSPVETWCKNNNVAYKILSDSDLDDIINGKAPSLTPDSKLFDGSAPKDLTFKVSLGTKPAGASGVSKVLVNNIILDQSHWDFNGKDTVTIKQSYLSSLTNGSYVVAVEFDNGSFKTGASITVANSSKGDEGNTQPPEALDTLVYEFYRDYPDDVMIPIRMNGATAITKLRIGTTVVDPQHYKLEDSALVISKEYLTTLDAAKYRVLPTFDDKAHTTIPNLVLYVFDKVADRGAPYLLQTRKIFDGKDVVLKFNTGYGDLQASRILALVFDDFLIMPDGTTKPFSDDELPELKRAGTAMLMLRAAGNVFSTSGDTLTIDGEYLASLNLTAGDHLVGAIFDNTEKTTDVRKVVLTVEEKTPTDPDPDKPGGGDDGDKPTDPDPDKPGGGDGGDKPTDPDPDKPGGDGDKPTDPDPDKPGGGDGDNKPTNPDPNKPGNGGDGDKPTDPDPDKPGNGDGGGRPVDPGKNKPGGSGGGNESSIPDVADTIKPSDPDESVSPGTNESNNDTVTDGHNNNTSDAGDDYWTESSDSAGESEDSSASDAGSQSSEDSVVIEDGSIILRPDSDGNITLSSEEAAMLFGKADSNNTCTVTCDCFSWAKMLVMVGLLLLGNTVSLYVVFGVLIPRSKRDKE